MLYEVITVGERDVEEHVHAVRAPLLRDLRHRAAFERLQRRVLDLVHADARPVDEGGGVLQVLAERAAERGIGVDLRLRRITSYNVCYTKLLRARRDEHRQHVGARAHHRLRAP